MKSNHIPPKLMYTFELNIIYTIKNAEFCVCHNSRKAYTKILYHFGENSCLVSGKKDDKGERRFMLLMLMMMNR